MRRLLSIILLTIISAMTINAGVLDDKCREIADALRAGDVDDAEDRATEVYARKTDCTAQNLADLTITYHQLTQRATDAVSRYDYVLKTIDCYNSAVGKDSNAARARFTEKRVDMDAVAKNYNANLSKFQQAVSDSMNF